MPEQIKKTLIISIYFALAISTLLVFWQVRNFDFVGYDDDVYVYENPHVLNGLTSGDIWWAFTAKLSSHWHPLTWLSLMLDCQLFGLNPGRIHLINLLLHIANTLLLFTVFKKMTGALWQSAFVAALFALHPLHVESVAWISERKDVLSTLLGILTIAAYYRYTKQASSARYLLTLFVFALGLMAKPMLVTLPFVLLLLDYWPLERKMSRRLLIEKIPFFAFSIISSVITFSVMQSSGTVLNTDILSLKQRIANVFLSYVQYIGKMFWPRNLTVFYPFDTSRILLLQAAICTLLLLVISVFILRYWQSQKYLLMGWLWFVITFIPVIGIVQVGGQALADRYTYIPYIGLFIMIAWGLPQILSKFPQRKITLGVSMVIALTSLGICAHRQTSFWENTFTLFSHANKVTQNNYVAYNNLGSAYAGLGRLPQAIEAFGQAIKIKPDYADAYYNLGFAYSNSGRPVEAIKADEQAIKFKPDYAEAYNNLGIAYSNIDHYKESTDAFGQAIKIKPDYVDAYYNLGIGYLNLGRLQEAIDAFKQTIKFKPDYAMAHCNLGFAYLDIGDKNSAMAEYNILKSLNSELANNLLNQINK